MIGLRAATEAHQTIRNDKLAMSNDGDDLGDSLIDEIDSDNDGIDWQYMDPVIFDIILGKDPIGEMVLEIFDVGNKDIKPLPLGSSHWDKLPNELKDMVFDHASPFTLLVNGRFKDVSKREYPKIHSLWMEVFEMDWKGDLCLLPELSNHSKLDNRDLAKVKSRSMYERLCELFPESTETNIEASRFDKDVESVVRSSSNVNRDSILRLPESPLRLLHVPMRHMWLDLLGDTLDKFPYARANDCIVEGHEDLLRHLIDTGKVDLGRMLIVCKRTRDGFSFNRAIDVAAVQGHLEVVRLLHQSDRQKASKIAMNAAAKKGRLDIVKFLHKNRSEGCTFRAMDYAAKNGHLEVFKWLHENRTEGCTTNAMDWAAENGHLKIVKFLHENRTEGCTAKAVNYAVLCGRLEVVKFFHEHYTELFTTNLMDVAAGNGHLHVVKWLHENRSKGCTTDAMDNAASNGFLDAVKWLHENRTEGCTTRAMDAAAKVGLLKIVEWLHENRTEGCTTDAMDEAIKNKHLNMVRFLRENRTEGCSIEMVYRAVKKDQQDIVRSLLEDPTQGFSIFCIKRCNTVEMAEMLVEAMSLERMMDVMEMAISNYWHGPGVDALRRSLENHGVQWASSEVMSDFSW